MCYHVKKFSASYVQSSWTKHAVEVDSPQPMSPSDPLADPQDSTCAQVISDSEIFCDKWVSMNAHKECQEQKQNAGTATTILSALTEKIYYTFFFFLIVVLLFFAADALMGKDLEIRMPRSPGRHPELHLTQMTSTKFAGKGKDKLPESDKNEEDGPGHQTNNVYGKSVSETADLMGGITNNTDAQLLNDVSDPPSGISRIPESKDKNDDGSMELPSLQLSLKRLRSTGEGGNVTLDDRNILRRSDQSAFSRYVVRLTKN